MIRLVVTALIALTAFGVLPLTASFASEGSVITVDMIAGQNEEKERALNARQDRMEAVRFLHDHIAEDARFRVTVDNPTMSAAHQGQVIELTKQDYINSFIQGTNFIADYEMNIETVSVDVNNAHEALSTDVLIERGVMMDPANLGREGRHFVSRTTCQTSHRLENDTLIATGGACHTEVSFEEFI